MKKKKGSKWVGLQSEISWDWHRCTGDSPSLPQVRHNNNFQSLTGFDMDERLATEEPLIIRFIHTSDRMSRSQ